MLTSFGSVMGDPPAGRVSSVVPTWTHARKPPTPLEESINRDSVCVRLCCITRTFDTDVHVLDRWTPATEMLPACTIPEVGMWLPLRWLDGHVHENVTNTMTLKIYNLGSKKKKKKKKKQKQNKKTTPPPPPPPNKQTKNQTRTCRGQGSCGGRRKRVS